MRSFSPGRDLVGRDILRTAAAEWAAGRVGGCLDEVAKISLSAAQVLVLLARACVSKGGEMPVPAVDAPVYIEALESRGVELSRDELARAARALLDHVEHSGMLPAAVALPGKGPIRPADLGAALARHVSSGDDPAIVREGEVEFLPARAVKVYGENVGPWMIHHGGFTGENLHRYTCLLAWSCRRLFHGGAA